MGKVICFGELLVRLSAEGYLRFSQTPGFRVSYTGSEGNAALALSNFGLSVSMVTKLPDHEIARNAIRQLKAYGVNTEDIVIGGERIGVYYLEKGASQRPSKIIYDRGHSAVAEAKKEDFDWDRIFQGGTWFHFSGITAGLSSSCAEICREACRSAKAHGLTVSCDLNYRKALWTKEEAQKVMVPLMEYVDVLFANEGDCSDVLGVAVTHSDVEKGILNREEYEELAKTVQERFHIGKVAISLRESISASDNRWSALLYTEGKAYFSRRYEIHLVDRVGGGDSFASGMIYALICGYDPREAVEFAAAASCLKQTIEYDYNLSSVEEIRVLMMGGGSGRVQR